MRENQSIAEYITKFRTEAARLKWDDAALRYQFRSGLAGRILDELARMNQQPATLSDMMEAALLIDNRYWGRVRERKFRGYARHTPGRLEDRIRLEDRMQPRPTAKRPAADTYHPRYDNGPTLSQRITPSHNSQFKPKSESSQLDRVIVNGKLTEAEKKRRVEKGLCNYCGGPHKLDNCPSRPAQGRTGLAARISPRSSKN